jgi:alanyl-tRNA synthetase
VRVGQEFDLKVDAQRRRLVARNHTLTHIVHAALHEILGDHIRQAGSYLDDQGLTFDFTHPQPITALEMRAIERYVHQRIWENHPLKVEQLPYAEAVKRGARAFFAEKYGAVVRVVQYGDFSIELCGGTHVPSTAEIGMCRVARESSVAAKTRRIEVTGGVLALEQVQNELGRLATLGQTLKVPTQDLERRLESLLAEQRQLRQQLKEATGRTLDASIEEAVRGARSVDGVRLVTIAVDDVDPEGLREAADRILDKLGSGVVAIGSAQGERANLVVKVSKELSGRFAAGNLVKGCAALIGGSGGGRPEMAQAGGNRPAGLNDALTAIATQLRGG